MSPPQVNFSEKKEKDSDSCSTPSQDQEEVKDVPSEKGDDYECLDFSHIVMTETERRAYEHHRRHNNNHRGRNRCICGTVFVIILGVVAVVMIPLALRWHHNKRRHHHEDFHCGNRNNEYNVEIDHDLKMIHAHKVPNRDMHIIHSYTRRIVAYKKDKYGVCFIDRLDESFDEGLLRWKSYKNTAMWDVRRFQVLSEKPIDVRVLEHFTDTKIFEMCRDAKSVWVKEMEVIEENTGKTVITF